MSQQQRSNGRLRFLNFELERGDVISVSWAEAHPLMLYGVVRFFGAGENERKLTLNEKK